MSDNNYKPHEPEDLVRTAGYRYEITKTINNLLYILEEGRFEISQYADFISKIAYYYDIDEWDNLCNISNAIKDLLLILKNFHADFIKKYNTEDDYFFEPFTKPEEKISMPQINRIYQKEIKECIEKYSSKFQQELEKVIASNFNNSNHQ